MKPTDELNETSPVPVSLAAGAILWRSKPFASDIAVVHRSRYGSEWCLPKGKVKEGETLEETALREVTEETGYKARIISFAGMLSFKSGETEKQVFFWHMSAVNELKDFSKDSEVDQLLWLPPEEAIKILDHNEQRELLKEQSRPLAKHRMSEWNWFTPDARYHRLSGSLAAYRTELEHRKCSSQGHDQVDSCWVISAVKLLSDAERALNAGDTDEAWKCFHAAQRLEIYSMNTDQILVKAAIVRNEVAKLTTWRQKAILELLDINTLGTSLSPTQNNKPPAGMVEKLFQATLMRDESYDNQAYKDKLVKEHIGLLGKAALFLALSFAIIWFLHKYLLPGVSHNIITLTYCILFGLLGATFSAAIKAQSFAQASRIPELLNARNITIIRLFIGGISAFILCIFLKSQFITNLFTLNDNDVQSFRYSYYFIGFCAGFSERLVLKTIESITKEKNQAKPE